MAAASTGGEAGRNTCAATARLVHPIAKHLPMITFLFPGPCCSPAVSVEVSGSVVAALQRTDPPMLVSRNGSEGAGLYVAMDPRHAKASSCGCMLCAYLPAPACMPCCGRRQRAS